MSQIIFVHGAGLDRTSWRFQTDFFAGSVAVDLPGHGSSDLPAPKDIAGHAEWLGSELRRMTAETVCLVGHSMGSLVVLETAARNPDLVDHLVLIATATRMPVNRDLLASANDRNPEAAATIMKWSLSGPSGIGQPKPWVDELAAAFTITAGNGVLARDFAAVDSYRASLDAARKVRCPTLVLLGEKDRMTKPQAAQELVAAIADARVVVLPGAGHMIGLERPAKVNDTITLFLTSD